LLAVRGKLRWRLAVGVGKTAHRSESLRMRLGGRLSAAFGGCLKSKAGPPAGTTAKGGGASGCGVAARDGLAFQEAFVAYGTGLRGGVAVLLVVAQCSGPLATSAPYGSRPVRRSQAESHLLWSGFVRLDTTGPVTLLAKSICRLYRMEYLVAK
jgi:hypothetical protein